MACGFLTLTEASGGTFQICPVCFWEDDIVQAADSGRRGGANQVSLSEARRNFQRLGAIDEVFSGSVRPPRPEEWPDDDPPSPYQRPGCVMGVWKGCGGMADDFDAPLSERALDAFDGSDGATS
ncbi:MAG: hypothetical protein KTR31_41005 [Myxococcales bacterium]|nr:hypothetical protein [Myxococcales bacterium]